MNFRIIKHIVYGSIYESAGSKFSYIIFFFMIVLIYLSILLGVMAVGDEKKILSDFFIATTQLGVLFWVLIMLSNAISSDIETKRIYLILSRPVKKYEYLLARFAGIIISSMLITIFITIVFFILLSVKKYVFDWNYILEIFKVFVKICVISSISLFFTVITTSMYSSFIISIMLWFVSHFVGELKFALDKVKGFFYFFKYLLYLLPDFSLFDKTGGYFYMFVYFALFFIISLMVFEKQDIY